MGDDKNKWDTLASDIVDGQTTAEDCKDDGIKVIEKLKQIASIAHAFKTQGQNHKPDSNADSSNILFTWGHLQVKEQIGEGSYGEVYRAYDATLDRDVALKLLKHDKLAPYQSRAFLQEARHLGKVRNRNVLAVHGANVNEGRAGMWSDLIVGNTIKAEQFTQTTDLLHLLKSACNALAAIHEIDLIHGDIKPNNLMRDAKGRIVLMDFGSGLQSQPEQISSGYLKGTPLYMAPELFSDQAISPASDVYALGTMMMVLMANRYPIQADNLADIKHAHKRNKQQPLNQSEHSHPRGLTQLVNQMIDPSPDKRPSASEISKQVEWISSAPQRRNKNMALTAIFSLLVLGITFTSLGFYRANKAQQLTAEEKQKTDAVNEFLVDMLESTSELGKGRNARMADVLIGAQQSIDEKYNNQPHAKAAILGALGNSYNSIELTEESIQMFEQSLLIMSGIYEKTDLSYLSTQDDLANALHKNNEFEASIAILKEIIAHADGKTKLIELASIRMANNLISQQKFSQAKAMLLPITSKLDDPKTAENNNSLLALQALTEAYDGLSNYPAAEKTARATLNWTLNYPDTYQLNIMAAQSSLAKVLSDQGKYDEAADLFKELYEQAEDFYGKGTKGYLIHVNNYSTILYRLDRSEEALPIQQEVYELMTKIKGEKSFDSLNTAINLANTMVTLKLNKKAEQLMRETWHTALEAAGLNHEITLKLEYNLAEFLNNTNRSIEAEKMARLTSKKMAEAFGENHLYPLLSNDNLAVSLKQLGRFSEAIEIHEKILPLVQQKVGNANPFALLVHQHYVDTLIAGEQLDNAQIQLSLLIEYQTKVLGADHEDTLKNIASLSSLGSH